MHQLIKSLPPPSPKPHTPHHLCIADILLLSDDDGGGEEGEADGDGDEEAEAEIVGAMNGFRRQQLANASCGFECASPRRVVSRLFRRLRERRRCVHCGDGDEKEPVDDRSPSLSSLTLEAKGGSGDEGSSVGTAKSDDSGPFIKDNRFNMGIACSMLYLIASSKNELSKMKELRTDVEMLLQNVKEEMRRKDSISETSISKASPTASCLTDLKEVSRCGSLLSSRATTAPYVLQGEETITISSLSIVCDESRKESVEGMDQLEAELEAELGRLQLQLETESFPQSKKITGNNSTAKRSGSLSLGEVVDPDESMTEVHGGVPPIELERRLHELLESRQQERIKELEAALDCIKLKLSEKEREAKWWKDTALLMSCHVPEPPDRS
ncbi:protein POLAR-like 1 [Punica granatum]|uniref:Uncharacterized protein n=2 Tax=Punica granatum TaxID=22663 RepID=A0A218XRA1_PUNGR|nr:protein POLAR-like 1 [Punica granatum]OWM86792.1 hypothetical protein CDL15_Pgr015828 [Punica granatum]PKI53227.1 hypothetical protein CRG98_026359 [Punica granatum]